MSRASDTERRGERRLRAFLRRAAVPAFLLLLTLWRPGEGTPAAARLVQVLLAAVVLVVFWHAQEFSEWRAARRNRPAGLAGRPRRWAFRLAGVLLFAVVAQHAFARSHSFRAALQMSDYDVSDGAVCRLVPNSERQWRDPRDGSVREQRINALGFRGATVPPRREHPDDIRIELYGDSMVYGIGVEDDETLAAALRREVQAAFPDRRVDVLNFGIPNTTVHTSLRNYFAVGRAFEPDVVVFARAVEVNPNDVCGQIREVRSSRVLSWLMSRPGGRELVNEYLLRKREVYSRARALDDIRAGLRSVAEDQRASGLVVAFMEHWEFGFLDGLLGADIQDTITEMTPEDLHAVFIRGGVDLDEYERRFAIPGDGHPTAEGQRYYAKRVAEVVVPLLRAKQVRPVGDASTGSS